MKSIRAAVVAALLLLSACAGEPQKVYPALWEVTGPNGERGWLFGTIHALPEPVKWRSAPVEAALAGSDRLVLEIDNSGDSRALGDAFERLATSPGLAPLLERVPATDRRTLAETLDDHGLEPGQFGRTETWAVALTLSRAANAAAKGRFGMEQELARAARGKQVVGLTSAEAQLRQFDSLPAAEQIDLLTEVAAETRTEASAHRLARAWSNGDMAQIEAETGKGLLADPELREALLLAPNRDWASQVERMLANGGRPLVAVGAAHMIGPQGIPALLTARGYRVRRLQ